MRRILRRTRARGCEKENIKDHGKHGTKAGFPAVLVIWIDESVNQYEITLIWRMDTFSVAQGQCWKVTSRGIQKFMKYWESNLHSCMQTI